MKAHPLADLLPLMGDGDYRQLVESIRTVGLLEPVTLLDGKVLDGRHRVLACEKLGITPRTREFEGNNPAAFVLAENVIRRHLSVTERAMIAQAFLPELREEAKRRQHEGQEMGRAVRVGSASQDAEPTEPIRATQQAADLVGVSRATVERADRVVQHAPELVEKIRAGEMSLPHAAAVASERRDTNGQPGRKTPQLTPGSKRESIVANAHRDRINKLVWKLDGYAQAIPTLRPDIAAGVATDAELHEWNDVLTRARSALLELRNNLSRKD